MIERNPTEIYQSGFKGIVQRLVLAWRFHGPAGLAAGVGAKMLKLATGSSRLQQEFQRHKERCFDARFNVSTSEEVAIDQLGIPIDQARYAVEYSPTSPVWFCHLIRGMDLEYDEFTFVDLGSGKGRTLLLASEFPFKSVMGVEISEQLHAIAVSNIANYRSSSQKCRHVRSYCLDATSFLFPESPLVVFLYNPFHTAIMQQVFNNLQSSFLKCNRPVYVVYSNPLCRELFDSVTWLEELESVSLSWVLYRSRSATGTRSGLGPNGK